MLLSHTPPCVLLCGHGALSATAVSVVIGALVAIDICPLGVYCCGVGSEVVRVWLQVLVDLRISGEVAQAAQ